MKKLNIFTIALLVSLSAFSQVRELKGALDLTFGMSYNSARTIMQSKGGIVNLDLGNAKTLVIENIKIGTLYTESVYLRFVNNKLFEIDVLFYPKPESRFQLNYDEIVEIIEKKYGTGRSLRNFSGGYRDGDGKELLAIELGYAQIATIWNNFIDKNVIVVEITPELFIQLRYADMTLTSEEVRFREQQNNSDF